MEKVTEVTNKALDGVSSVADYLPISFEKHFVTNLLEKNAWNNFSLLSLPMPYARGGQTVARESYSAPLTESAASEKFKHSFLSRLTH